MAPVTAIAEDFIVYPTAHGRVIVHPGDSYTIDAALAPGRQFLGAVRKLPPPLPPAAQTITSDLDVVVA